MTVIYYKVTSDSNARSLPCKLLLPPLVEVAVAVSAISVIALALAVIVYIAIAVDAVARLSAELSLLLPPQL